MAYTVQEAIDHGVVITVHCARAGCQHNAEFQLQKLGERLGFDHGVMHDDLKRKFRCSKCGSRKVTFIYSSEESSRISKATYFGSGYAKAKGI